MEKAPDAFRTISEVADEIDVPQHVLRFWESRFQQIRPLKRGGGRRYYRRDDVDLLRGVRHLLYGEGYTIRGVQRILREQGADFVQNVWRAGAERPTPELAEDKAAAASGAAASEDRLEPNLFGFTSSADSGGAGDARREPKPEPTPEASAAAASRIGAQQARKLKAALDELVACRRIIDSAFRQG